MINFMFDESRPGEGESSRGLMGPVCPGKGPEPSKPVLCLPGTWGGDVDREAKSSLM